MTWETVDWLRSITALPLLLKGILTAEDAVLALERGVSGIIVSNHGGRQLDGVVTSIEALPEIVDAVAGRCEVYLDSGIRRGADILKALVLGARAVLVGRPVLWGLAADGARGVQHVLEILHTELERAMKLAGCPRLSSSNRSSNGREFQLAAHDVFSRVTPTDTGMKGVQRFFSKKRLGQAVSGRASLTGGKTFSARAGTMLAGLRKPTELIVIVVTLLAYGCPIQAIVHAYGLDERTVASWRDRAGKYCEQVHQV